MPALRVVTVVGLEVAGIALQFHDLADLGKRQVKGTLPQFFHELPCLLGAAGVGFQFDNEWSVPSACPPVAWCLRSLLTSSARWYTLDSVIEKHFRLFLAE